MTRTILDYLALSSEADAAFGESRTSSHDDHLDPDTTLRQSITLTYELRRRALDLILSQLREIYSDRPRPGQVFSVPKPSSSHHLSTLLRQKGGWAAFARALLLLYVDLTERAVDDTAPEPPPGCLETPTLIAVAETLITLARDRQFQYLLWRQWEEAEVDIGATLQAFLLRAYTHWYRHGGPDSPASGPLTRSCLLELWAVLTAQRPLEIQAGSFASLASALLQPLLSLSGQEGVVGAPIHSPVLLHSLVVLGHATRGSPSFRNYVRAQNHREKLR